MQRCGGALGCDCTTAPTRCNDAVVHGGGASAHLWCTGALVRWGVSVPLGPCGAPTHRRSGAVVYRRSGALEWCADAPAAHWRSGAHEAPGKKTWITTHVFPRILSGVKTLPFRASKRIYHRHFAGSFSPVRAAGGTMGHSAHEGSFFPHVMMASCREKIEPSIHERFPWENRKIQHSPNRKNKPWPFSATRRTPQSDSSAARHSAILEAQILSARLLGHLRFKCSALTGFFPDGMMCF